jgi:hypothetical protein
MPTQVQFRRGTSAQNNSFTGAAGELSIDSDNNTIRVHDGSTSGGHAVAKRDLSNINNVGIITATDFNSSSDINLKTNIQTIENPISKLFEINGVTFNWIENEKASVGVIAQDVEKALPQLVNDMGSHKVVNYNGLIGLLVECIKHQQRQIDELKEHMIGS